MSNNITFVVVSGKYDYNEDGTADRNTKYISEPFTDFADALREWRFSEGYAFNEIELWRDGRREGLVNPVPVDLQRGE